ncbi:hypothetical protein Droror1_Dr00027765 [Drosera rotundifolia]
MAYVFTFWTFYMLHKEYRNIMTMRLEFLANADRLPDQFSVLVRNVPPDPDESVSDYVEHFFRVNHPDHYLLHGVVYHANKLAQLVEKKKRSKNWLTYYENKFERYPAIRPTTKAFVVFGELGLMLLTTTPQRFRNCVKRNSRKGKESSVILWLFYLQPLFLSDLDGELLFVLKLSNQVTLLFG